ncbi:MAG: InlB B-repeat-containing protein, partial [Clostridia bacterium]|nr:InlB B-repeat-containing protein [Clostridia bacterium]
DPTKEGYTFAGWDAEIPTTMPAENVTITAQWTINQYTITFETAGGSTVAPITQDYGTAVTAPVDPTKEGYTFAGWDAEIPTTMPAENVTITAKWTTNQYTITFETAGGSMVAPITQDYGTYVTAPADPTKEGYTFAGWNKTIPTTMPAENMTITAKWSILPVIISPTSEQTVTVNEGEQASMSIKAQNAVAYQWYVNYNDGTGWHKCGKDSTTYTSSITTLSNNGYRYKCVAIGESGDTVESVLFTLKVLKNVDVPQTSDPTQIGLWMILCIISCAGLFALTFNAKKQKVE